MACGHSLFTTKYAPTVRDFLAVKVPLDERGVFDLFCWEVGNPTCQITIQVHTGDLITQSVTHTMTGVYQ